MLQSLGQLKANIVARLYFCTRGKG